MVDMDVEPPRSVGRMLPNRQRQYIVVLIFIAQKKERGIEVYLYLIISLLGFPMI